MTAKPNILIFMTDQQRGDVVLEGHPVKTPVLDAFRRRAVTFSETFCPSPHCCPSRASFFTGVYPSEHGVWNNVTVQNALTTGLKPGTRLWSTDLVAAGYTCDFSGKWHVSYEQGPRDYAWTEHRVNAGPKKDHAGIMGLEWDGYAKMAEDLPRPERVRKPGEIVRPGWRDYVHYGINEQPFGDQHVVDVTKQVLASKDATSDPWCLYCGTLGPHDPYVVPQRFLDMYADVDIPLPANFHDTLTDRPHLYQRTRSFFDQLTDDEHREAIRHYWAFCTYEDWLFGQVLEALEASGQADNTIVMYCSDHGDYTAEHGLWCKGLPCFRGAYNVPMMIAGPGIVGDRVVDAPVSLTDVAPTVLELTGTESDLPCSGYSLVPWLRGETPDTWRTAVFTQSNGNEQYGIQRSITADGWKYVYNGYDFDELYDLSNDPHEQHNLNGDPRYAQQLEDLCSRMWRFASEHDDTCINPYIMVGMAPYGPAYGLRTGVTSGG
ncbi:MAG: sulfatase-like hydrolase/transferase [Planctomycetota bacterium]|jgi:choline-sulfatase|nr:sulfatase-like hydrolase/transferase [Planctomycetota bacterium]